MTTFDKRKDAFENKFAHDEALRFKAEARRNKLLGQWAADLLGKTGADAEEYVKSIIVADFEEAGDDDVFRKVRADFVTFLVREGQFVPLTNGIVFHYRERGPGGTLLGYANGDHWAVALPFTEEAPKFAAVGVGRNVFPRDAMLEAVLLYLREAL